MPVLSRLHRPTLMMIDPSRLHGLTLVMAEPSHPTMEKMVLLSGLSHPDHQLVSDPVVLRYVQCRPHHTRFLLRLLENEYQHYVLDEDEKFEGKQRKEKRQLESEK